MCEPRKYDNGASDLWTLTAYCYSEASILGGGGGGGGGIMRYSEHEQTMMPVRTLFPISHNILSCQVQYQNFDKAAMF